MTDRTAPPPSARLGRRYDAACRRAIAAFRDGTSLAGADARALLDGQRDERQRAAVKALLARERVVVLAEAA